MTYVDGFVIPVARDKREEFIAHAQMADGMMLEFGALRIVECWEDDVPDGKHTDFRRAVDVKEGEVVVFSWIEWPDKNTRDKAFAAMMADPRMDPAKYPIPFDGKRMIVGGFLPIVEVAPS